MKTESFNLSKNTLALLEKNGIITATPIQKKIIPAILAGKDVLAQSETGSGKTISFAIPILEQIQTSDGLIALILVPTRELCNQVTDEFIKYSQGKRLGITAVYGGVSIDNQIRKIRKTNVIIATPGRLIDLIDRNVIHLDKIKYLVFDEADRMLDMGFIHDIELILKHMTQKLQTMLFSATVSKEITILSKKYLFNPVHVILESSIDPVFLKQTYYQTTNDQKIPLLIHLLKQERDLTLVFCNRKHITAKLADKLTRFGIQAKCLHGDLTQGQRERVTSDFRNKRFNILIATDVASRGLHIEDITHVYNYEIPKDVDSYTHRVGRTARAGKKGEAISFVTKGEDQKFFKQILFNYRGSISLKAIDPSLLPTVESSSSDKRRSKERFQSRDDKPFRRDDKPFRRDDRTRFSGDERKRDFTRSEKPKFGSEERKRDSSRSEKPRFGSDERKREFSRSEKPRFGSDERKRDFRKSEKPKFDGEERKRDFRKSDKPGFGSDERKRDFRKSEKPKFGGEERKRDFGKSEKPKFGGEERKRDFGKSEKPKFGGERIKRDFGKGREKSRGDNKFITWGKEKPDYKGKRKPDSWDETISLHSTEANTSSSDRSKSKNYSDRKSNLKSNSKTSFFGKKKSGSWEDRKPKFWSEGKSNKRRDKK